MIGKEERLRLILDTIGTTSVLDVAALSAAAGVSQVTVRKDLQHLEREGRIRRSYGKVWLADGMASAAPARRENGPAKKTIGALAAGLAEDEDLMFIGPGRNCLEFARHLTHCRRLSVITMNLSAAAALADAPDIRLLTLPGDFTRRNGTYYVTGTAAARYVSQLYVDKAFITADGLDIERGFSVLDEITAQIYRGIAKNGTQVCALVPSNRFDRNARAALGPLEFVRTIVTDAQPPEPYREAFEARGIEVLYPEV